MRIKIFFSCILLFQAVTLSVFAQRGNYNKGWEAFNKNDRREARNYFNSAVETEPESKAEAYLSLALLDWCESKEIDAFSDFQKFYTASENPYPYLYAVFSLPFMNPSSVMTDAQFAFFQKIWKDPKMNGTLKAMVSQKIGQHYMDCNNFAKAKEFFSGMNTLNNWQVLGVFDNISGSGFDKDWGAVSKATPESVFKNKTDAEVKWYVPSANKPDNWFYFDFYFRLNGVIVYAQTFVNSSADREVYLRAGTSGSLKIWINDALLSSIPEERNCDLDIYAYKVNLNKGVNRILVQIGQSEISAANFMIRLTDADGNPVDGITSSATYSDYQKSVNQQLNDILPFFAEEYFERKINEIPDNPLYYFMAGEIYLRNDKAYEGIKVLKKAEQFAPKSSFLNYRLAEAYMRAQNRTDYSREMENIKLNDPESYTALSDLFDDAFSTEKYTEAADINNKIKQLYGENKASEWKDIQLLSAQKKVDELIDAARKSYARYPYDYNYAYLNYLIAGTIYNDAKAATFVLENYCKRYFNASALDVLADSYISRGETNKGLNVYKRRIELLPYATGYRSDYAMLLQKMQKYDEALAVLNDIQNLAPYLPDIYAARGYIYKELKAVDQSKENFKKAIYYFPASYDSRMQLRLLDNKKDIFDLFPAVNLDSLIAKAPAATDYPDENSVVVMENNQLVFYPEGAQEHRKEIAIKILNQSGIETWKQYGIEYNDNSQKLIMNKYEIIKANGQKLKAETDNEGTVVFTNLEVGDVLHLDYRLQDYYSGALSKHFFDNMSMQYTIPSMYAGYSILVPKGKNFNYVVKNADIAPSISEVEDMKLYRWENVNRPAVKDEPYMSPMVDISGFLVFSSISDWRFIGDWYRDLTTNKINAHSDYVFKETYSEILKGKENASQLEKAKLFYEYILKNITYSNVSFMQGNFIPQKASRTITTRLGDCKDVSTLFVALCREAGIKADLVLLNSRTNGKNELALPSCNFNHCIAELDLDGKVYYLELTDNKLPFGSAIDDDLHSDILPIPYKDEPAADKLLSMDMPFRTKNEIKRKAAITINDNDMSVAFSSVRYGQLASFYRQAYADKGTDDRFKYLNQSIASSWNVPVKVSGVVFDGLDNLCDSVSAFYKLEAKGVLQNVAGMKIFKLPWSDAVTSLSFVSLEERKYPLEYWAYLYSDSEEDQISIILPQDKQFVEIPKNVKLECPVASYELSFEVKSGKEITVKRTMTKKKDVVLPDEYKAFRDFMHAVSENDGKQYAIK
ncbi:MAG: DUF3857 domain-containing protein [Candidatus Azobacteroides sp.]|nr:DUF3857 domain-containing protein [Candidatus Azobacteroides sp.]